MSTPKHSASSSTSSAAPTAVPGCPGQNGTTFTSSTSNFLRFCQTNLESPLNTNVDLTNSFQASFNSCIAACTSYNQDASNKGTIQRCTGVTYTWYVPDFPYGTERCFLKNGTDMSFQPAPLGNVMASALMTS